MKMLRIIFLSCLVSMSIAAFFAGISYGEEKQSYGDLLKRVKEYDRSVDFGALRLAYAATPAYNPYSNDGDTRDSMYSALRDKKYDEALRAAQKILENNYVDIDAHTVCKIAYRQMADNDKSALHAFVAGGLIDSILASGDGTAPETAFVVINTSEEYILMRVLRLKFGKQSLIGNAGHNYDKFEAVEPKSGNALEIYFNIDVPYGWLNKKLK